MELADRPVDGGSLSDYDYELPPGLIAQRPLPRRDASRLLYLPAQGAPRHHRFTELTTLLKAGDLVVLNETRVLPARIRFRIRERDAEILLLNPAARDEDTWECLVRPGKAAPVGACLQLRFALWADVVDAAPGGTRVLRFAPPGRLRATLDQVGEAPLPPYIKQRLDDPERYQTVYARVPGSAAAPTAGLHFTAELLAGLAAAGVEQAALTLRIGLDTFQPIRTQRLDEHVMHSEIYRVPRTTRVAIAACRRRGGRVVAVGTTVARALEAAADRRARGDAGADAGATDIFIRPGFRFREVDLLLTNFHLPKSSLLMLVSAFAGRRRAMAAYREAIAEGYRFYSFGDAMLLERA